MKRLYFFIVILSFLAACSFAPLSVSVPDFEIPSGSSASFVCYSKVTESVPVNFTSVSYEADALYTPNQGLGDNSDIKLSIFGRATDPDSSSNSDVKCISATTADVLLSTAPVSITADTTKRVSVGGTEFAKLVTNSEYWLGASLDDGTLFSLPGKIEFSNGEVKAFF